MFVCYIANREYATVGQCIHHNIFLMERLAGVLGFDSRRGLGIFLFTTASRTALGPTQPPIQWVLVSPSLGVNRQGREADHSPPSSAEVKEWVELYLLSPNMPSWCGAPLKHRATLPSTLPIQWVPGALSLGVKRPECEADQSPPRSAEVKNTWSYTTTPPLRLHCMVLS
jgi:hypothetical protein